MEHCVIDTPIGKLGITWSSSMITRIHLRPAADIVRTATPSIPPMVAALVDAMHAYFNGHALTFPMTALAIGKSTDFQNAVRARVCAIPMGQTCTYGEVASDVGAKGAARAVGTVMATNRFPLLIPCHRVVAVNGLGGYDGGLPMKQFLLDHEAGRLAVGKAS